MTYKVHLNFFSKERVLNLIFSLVLFLFGLLVYTYIPTVEEFLKNSIIKAFISVYDEITDNALSAVKKEASGRIIYRLKTDKNLYNKTQEIFSIISGSQVKYLYIIYHDDGLYRFLIDLSKEDRAEAGEIFVPTIKEIKILSKIDKTGEKYTVYHEDSEEIGATLIKPIKENGTVKAYLFVDFSVQLIEAVKKVVHFFGILSYFVLIVSTVFIFLTAYFFIKTVYLKNKAFVDPLTKVYNRNYLNELLKFIDINSYAVILVDVDFFKKINDTFGHKVGDEVLKKVAQLLKSSIRSDEDYIFRFGGEEFLLLVKKDRNDRGQILNVVNRIFDSIRNFDFGLGDSQVRITVSAGIFNGKAKNFEDAVKKADSALYRAKREGRNRYEFYIEDADFPYLLQINELIEKREVFFEYQPVVDLNTKKIVYLEALIRLKNGKEGQWKPEKFRDTIKGTFLYSKLTKLAIEENVKLVEKYRHIKIGINLLPSDVANSSIKSILCSVDRKTAERIVLEVVETEEVASFSDITKHITQLKKAGYIIAVDDFGSGYSNFDYLLNLEMDYLKFNSGLIAEAVTNRRSERLIQMVVQFCKEFNIKTIAEFVENQQVCKKILSLNVDYGQGYYFSKPAGIEKYVDIALWETNGK